MSGIAGFIGPGADEAARGWLAGDRPRSAESWSDADAAFVVTGGSGGSIVERHGLVFVGEIRLDNRDEIAARIPMPRSSEPDDDLGLVADAWRAWGEDALPDLVGDFSLAIWDQRSRRLWLARDFPGVRPLFWYRSATWFAFASTPAQLLTCRPVPRRPNVSAISRYLLSVDLAHEESYFEGVAPVVPGHVVRLTGQTAERRAFYSLSSVAPLDGVTDEDAEQAFRDVFLTAVRCRAADARPVAAELSGGLDSATVVGAMVESGMPPHRAYSVDFAEGGRDPVFADSVASRWGIERVVVSEAWWSDRDLVRARCGDPSSPLTIDGPVFQGGLHATASDDGVEVLLTGVDGDASVGHGLRHLADLLVGGRYRRLQQESSELARRLGVSTPAVLRSSAVGELLPAGAIDLVRRVRGRADTLPVLLAAPLRRDLGLDPGRRWRWPPLERPLVRSRQIQLLQDRSVSEFLEVLDASARRTGVELRHPYYDRRLIELCVSLPGDQKLRAGTTRSIQRRALRGLAPDGVLARPDKGGLGPDLYGRIVASLRDRHPSVVGTLPRSEPFIDLDAYRGILDRSDRSAVAAAMVWGAVRLEWWLEAWDLAG